MTSQNATVPASSSLNGHDHFLVKEDLKKRSWDHNSQKNNLKAVPVKEPKIIGIVQPNYIPWKGYFDMIRLVDEFILLDDVQYTRDWRNRNLIKTRTGLKWLTIPVSATGRHTMICDVKAADSCWRRKHWHAIVHSYSRSKYFDLYQTELKELFLQHDEMSIARIDHAFLVAINKWLNISTPITFSSDYNTEGRKSEKILNLCKQANATTYLTGPAAMAYLDERSLKDADIDVQWMDYSNYSEYRQRFPPFEHRVSVLDLLFNEGPGALNYLKP